MTRLLAALCGLTRCPICLVYTRHLTAHIHIDHADLESLR